MASLNPAERLRRRHLATEYGERLRRELRERLPGIPLEMELQTIQPFGEIQPVDEEDGSLLIRTDGTAVLRVQAIANDLARSLRERTGIEIVPRVWPRTIWCRRSIRLTPVVSDAATLGAPAPVVFSARDDRGNTLLCYSRSHAGEHDFSEPNPGQAE